MKISQTTVNNHHCPHYELLINYDFDKLLEFNFETYLVEC